MWIKLSISLAISGLIQRVKCTDIPYSDMYLPNGTNGFVCGLDLFTIDHLREVVQKAMKSTFFENYYSRFPKLFEDTHLFNVKSDILLSWPALLNEKFYSGSPGTNRLIINIRGQILGMVIVNSKDHTKKVIYEKCSPVHRSLWEVNNERRISDVNWSPIRPTFGYSCGLRVIPVYTIDTIIDLVSKDFFRDRLTGKEKLSNLQKYTGDEFVGPDLYSYPLRKKTASKITYGAPGRLRVIFDMTDRKFKGIINIVDSKEKCVTVWDLSSTSSDSIYSPSSVLDLEETQDIYWPETCFGYMIKAKTMWLYLEFAFKNWSSNLNGRQLNFPIVKQKVILLWPMRMPETHIHSSNDIFAIGYDTRLGQYSLYHVKLRDGILTNQEVCLEFPHNIIAHLQGILGLAIQS